MKKILIFILPALLIVHSCTQIQGILIVNDTNADVAITYNNATIAKTFALSLSPGDSETISLYGVWPTGSIEETRENLRKYLVIRFMKEKNQGIELRGDDAIEYLTRSLARENDSWVMRLGKIFK